MSQGGPQRGTVQENLGQAVFDAKGLLEGTLSFGHIC